MDELIATLTKMKTDVSVAVHLYEQLYKATLVAIVQSGTEESLDKMAFLSYDTADGIRELPLFTSKATAEELQPPPGSIFLDISGPLLWPRLLNGLISDSCQAAVDPMRGYGIRLTRAMVLGMVGKYGQSHGGV